jgi:hypothetical protein
MTARLLAITCILVACGGAEHDPFPVGSPDAGSEGLPPFTGDGDVLVTVTIGGIVTPGLAVYFQGSDSSPIAAVATNTSGVAGAATAAGGYVTVVVPTAGGDRLFTFAATQPGDRLRLDLDGLVQPAASEVPLTVATLGGAIGYEIFTACGSGTLDSSAAGTIATAGCSAQLDFLVVALDDNGAPFASFARPGVELSGAVNLSGSYTPYVQTSFAYKNVPPAVPFVSTYAAILGAQGRLVDASAGNPVSGVVTNTIDLPDGSGLGMLVATTPTPAPEQLGEQVVVEWGPFSASYALDLASAMQRAYAAPPSYAVTTHGIAWDENGAGIVPQSVRASIRVFRPGAPEGRSWSWSIIGPRQTAPEFVYPVLPVTNFDYNPAAADTVTIGELTNVAAPGGYDAFRPTGFGDVMQLVAGASGRVVIQRLFTPDPL